MKINKISWIWIVLFSLGLSLPVILSFFHAGFFPTHDGEWAIVRLSDMFRTIRDFQIPARYSGNLNFGYGYPLFNFVYPLPYYLGVIIHFLGFGFVDSIKIMFALSVVFSGLFMFLASRILWKNTWAGIVSAIMYIYFPYRMVDLYVRGSIGESLSFVLFPLLFYLAVKLINKFSVLVFGAVSICIAFLIATHNIMAVFFMPIFIAFAVSQVVFNKARIKPIILSIALGFGISAFFWIPALLEKSNILLSKVPIADRSLYFVKLDQFLLPKWGYGVPTDPDGFSYQLGIAHLAVFFLVVFYFIFLFVRKKSRLREFSIKIALLLIVLTGALTFLLFKPSDFLWRNIPFLSEINYPWIILGLLGFLISLLAGFLSINLIGKYLALFLSLLAILLVLPYAKPQYYFNKGDDYYLTNDATTTSSNELMPLWVKKFPLQRPREKIEIIKGNGNIENVFFNSKQVNFSVNALSEIIIRINTIYYPGWEVFVDNKNVPIFYSNEYGAMEISVPLGSHSVQAKFGETTLRLFSNLISVISTMFLFVLVFKTKKDRKYDVI